MWYAENGRQFRNDIAHGKLDPHDADKAFMHVTTMRETLVADFVQVWTERPQGADKRPGRL